MRAFVEIKWGPSRGRKRVLEPGSTLRVGRTERCDLVVEHDRQMSAVHFALTWDGVQCHVRDSDTIGGTLVNGERTAESSIGNGGWIKAGDTVFMIYFEGHTPPRRGAETALTPEKQRALDLLAAETAPLYALLDAARTTRILELVRESSEEYRSLYDGVRGDALSEEAPYLVRLSSASKLLPLLVAEGWGKRWGVYLTSRVDFIELRRHLRRFLLVEDETTRTRVYFRYYDPEVLGVLLRCATARQRGQLFAMIDSICLEQSNAALLRVTVEG